VTRQRVLKLALVTAVALGALGAWRFGVFELFADPARMKSALLDMGAAGYAAYLAVFAFLQPVGVPGIALTIGASYVWPKPIAFALSLVGSVLASTTGFLFARFVARDWIAANMPARFRGYDERIASRGFATAFFLRLVFMMNPFLHGLFGISKVRFRSYVLGSLLGYVPGLVLWVWASAWAIDLVKEAEPREYAPIAIGVVGLVVAVRVGFWWRRRRRESRALEVAAARTATDSAPPASLAP
jgi:uncharacterized membrane protein YdjX (TVP38/TMEM64 family)